MPKKPVSPEQLLTRAIVHTLGSSLAHAEGQSVRPMYLEADEDALEAIGSCVLIRIGADHFVVTAAHVVDWREKGRIAFAGDKDIWYLPDQWYLSAPMADRRTDKLDFGFARLPASLVSELGDTLRWITADEIDLQPRSARPDTFYTAVGFPTKQEGRNIAKFSFKPVTTIWSDTELPTPLYVKAGAKEGYSRADHLLIKFDVQRAMSVDGITSLPNQMGISGGGMWRQYAVGPRSPMLVGINLYGKTSGTRFLAAVQIRYVVAGILQVYPTLKEYFAVE